MEAVSIFSSPVHVLEEMDSEHPQQPEAVEETPRSVEEWLTWSFLPPLL